jgi:hypothetical protein
MTTPDLSHGTVEQAEYINWLVCAWHDLGYENPPSPDCKAIPPLGERSAQAIKAGHGAIGTIDELLRQLYALRSQLVSELRQDEDIRAERIDRMLAARLTPAAADSTALPEVAEPASGNAGTGPLPAGSDGPCDPSPAPGPITGSTE